MGRLIRLDWAIKNILRQKANFEILEGFLSELLGFDVTISEILESESNKAHGEAKMNRVDILVRNHRDELILVEVQTELEMDYLQRILFGSSVLVVDYLKRGEPYAKIRKIYTISIVYFNLGSGKDYIYHGQTVFEGLRCKDVLHLDSKQQATYQVSTPGGLFPEHYIIKVPQFDDKIRDTLDEWIYFLKNEEIKNSFRAKGIQSAYEKLEVLKLPKDEQLSYRNYLMDLHYQASMVHSSWDAGIASGGRDKLILWIWTAEDKLGLAHEDEEVLKLMPIEELETKAKALLESLDETKAKALQEAETANLARAQAELKTEQAKHETKQAKNEAEQAKNEAEQAKNEAEQAKQRTELAEQRAEQERLAREETQGQIEKERGERLRLERELEELRRKANL